MPFTFYMLEGFVKLVLYTLTGTCTHNDSSAQATIYYQITVVIIIN